MDKLTTTQIKVILDGAPEGATHVDIEGDYWVMQETQAQFWCDKFEWSYAEPQEPLRDLSDLREILELRQEVERLERYKDLAEQYLCIYNCKKCNGLVNYGHICFTCSDSNPSESKGDSDD